MKRLIAVFIIALFSLMLHLPLPVSADANLEWTLKKQLKLEAAPLDIASSLDGKWMFVLAKGEILVYSGDSIVKRIPVDKAFDRLSYSAPHNTLMVSSSSEKMLKLIELELVQNFSLEGLPFKGPKDAPVTMVVFSDYQ